MQYLFIFSITTRQSFASSSPSSFRSKPSNYYSISLSIAFSFRGSRFLIDLKSKCCRDNDIWWNNIENCDALGGKAPEVVFARRHS